MLPFPPLFWLLAPAFAVAVAFAATEVEAALAATEVEAAATVA